MTSDHFSPEHIPAKEEGSGCHFCSVIISLQRSRHVYGTVYQAQPVISVLHTMMSEYKCAFVGSDAVDRPHPNITELNSRLLSHIPPNLKSALNYNSPPLICCIIPHQHHPITHTHTAHTCCDTLYPSYQIP